MESGTERPYCAFKLAVLLWLLPGEDGGKRPACFTGAVLNRVLGISVVAVLLASFGPASGQAQTANATPPVTLIAMEPATIARLPPLSRAVLTGDPEQVRQALEKAPESINERLSVNDTAHATPLILAAALSDPEIVGLLVQRGANVTMLDDFNRSAFWYAALREDVQITARLVRAKGSEDVVNASDKQFRRTPLHLAVRGNASGLVSLLVGIGAGASELQKDILSETPLDYCKENFTIACKELPPPK